MNLFILILPDQIGMMLPEPQIGTDPYHKILVTGDAKNETLDFGQAKHVLSPQG